MFTAESIRFAGQLVRTARGYRARHSDQNIDARICKPTPPAPIADDPNDSLDPDDNTRNPDADIPPPEMPANLDQNGA